MQPSDPLDADTVLSVDNLDSGPHTLGREISVVVMSPRFAATYRLPASGEVTIGRSKSVEIYVDDHSVSRNHAIITLGPQLAVRDLGSSNGTRVGGVRLAPDVQRHIKVGDAITVGSATLLLQRALVPIAPRRFWSAGDLAGQLEEECARAKRAQADLVLACLRVDRLALDIGVRQLLAQTLGPTAIVGETLAEEYAIIHVDTGLRGAREVMERIASGLAARHIKALWGLAQFSRDGTSAHQLIAAAQLAIGDSPVALPASKRPVFAEPQMHELHAFVRMIAAGQLSVLIQGETGVGKEVIAEEIHRLSPRTAGPFLRLNCAALSEALLESELFGYEKGAFTSAEKAKPGLIETASGGTVFLDEIGELPMNLQVKLLRVIEEKQAIRVGGLKPRPLDVRFVAATNRDLEEQAARGRFREDLYYRLAGATVKVPPLRERPADIEPLARLFVQNAVAHLGGHHLELDPAALDLIRAYGWPGNIRELRNVIERAALICGSGPIRPVHLPGKMRGGESASAGDGSPGAPPPAPSGQPDDGEREEAHDPEGTQIIEVLAACGGNQSRAAKLLGLSRSALIRRLEKLGVVRPRKAGRQSS
jgi:two-component system, NtrC family, response regulator AtoC